MTSAKDKGILIMILVSLFLLGLSYNFPLNKYEEECIAYKQNITYKTNCWCNSTFQYLMWCNWDCCNCPEDSIVYYGVPIYTFTDECSKYRLVRYVK